MHGGNGLYYCRLQKVRASPEQSVNQALPKNTRTKNWEGYERGKKTGSFGGGSGL